MCLRAFANKIRLDGSFDDALKLGKIIEEDKELRVKSFYKDLAIDFIDEYSAELDESIYDKVLELVRKIKNLGDSYFYKAEKIEGLLVDKIIERFLVFLIIIDLIWKVL